MENDRSKNCRLQNSAETTSTYQRRMNRTPAGPRDRFWGLKLARQFSRQPLEFLTNLVKNYGDWACFRLGPYQACWINHPDLIRDVLVTRPHEFPKLSRYCRTVRTFSGDSMFIAEGDDWRRQRKIAQPAFNSRLMDNYALASARQTRKLLERWSDGAEFDLSQEMKRLALTSIAGALFHVDLSDRAEELLTALTLHTQALRHEFRSAVVLPDWMPTPAKRRKRYSARVLRGLVAELFRERQQAAVRPLDALTIMTQSVEAAEDSAKLSSGQALDQSLLLLLAGQDDTTATLSWFFYLMATHPQVEQQVRDEISTVIGTSSVSHDDVARLPVTQSVVKETMRLYPPTWSLVPRGPLADVTLGSLEIRRGTWIIISPYATHRDPRYFPDPYQFQPERFSPACERAISQYVYFPFGLGPRGCIGGHFANINIMVAVVTILQHFRIVLSDVCAEVKPDPSLALRPRGGLRVRVHSLGRRA